MYLYINGVLVASNTGTYTNTSLTNSTYYVGSAANNSANYWNGLIDEVKIYNYARNANEIKADYLNYSTSIVAFGYKTQGIDTSTNIVDGGLKAHFKLDETTSNTCTGGTNDSCDSSGNGNDGAWHGSVSASQGKYDGSVSFPSGNGDYIDIADSASLTPSSTDMSISLWVYPENIGSTQRLLVKKHSSSPWYSYFIELESNGTIQSEWSNTSNTARYAGSASAYPLSNNHWYHIVFVKSGTTFYIYINGVDRKSWQDTPSGTLKDSNGVLRLGANNSGDKEFTGKLDDVRIYDRALNTYEKISYIDITLTQ